MFPERPGQRRRGLPIDARRHRSSMQRHTPLIGIAVDLHLHFADRFAKTFPVVLTSFQGQTEIAWELMCAGATIQVLPIVFLTLFVQKYIVSGLTMGAVK